MIFSGWFHPKTILLKLRMWFWLSLNAILKVRAGLGTFFENSFEILMKNAIRDCWKKLRTSENPIHHILLSKECIWNVFTTGNIVQLDNICAFKCLVPVQLYYTALFSRVHSWWPASEWLVVCDRCSALIWRIANNV